MPKRVCIKRLGMFCFWAKIEKPVYYSVLHKDTLKSHTEKRKNILCD